MSITAVLVFGSSIAAATAPEVPTPGWAYLLASSPFVGARLLLAQSPGAEDLDAEADERGAAAHPNPEEEKALEADMERARRRTRRPPVQKAAPAATPVAAPAAEAPSGDEADGEHQHDGGGMERYRRRYERHHDDAGRHLEDDDYDDSDDYDDRYGRADASRELLYDGHGWRYYMVWGIVEWVVAGQLWVGSAVFFASMAGALTAAAFVGSYNDILAIAYGAIAVGAGLGGGIVAWRAGTNMGRMRELKAGEMPE